MASSYQIGTTEGGMATLDTLYLRDPQPAPAHYSEYIELLDGTVRGVGWLQAEWRWSVLSTTDIASLRAFCTGSSAAVYIVTPDADGAFVSYTAIMSMPQIPEVHHGDYFEDFAIAFTKLVEIPGTT